MNLIDAIQALSLREKEELYSHIGQLIYEEKFYKEDEGEIGRASCRERV